jgi:hypothetical protein
MSAAGMIEILYREISGIMRPYIAIKSGGRQDNGHHGTDGA